jgi:His-Xaa-Ser system radical SAM maturase HxsB
MYKLNYFNFRRLNNEEFLITNDLGKYLFLKQEDFYKLTQKEELPENIYKKLVDNYFIYDGEREIFATSAAKIVRKQKGYNFLPTSLHIFVITKNCNFNCLYCQAGNLNQSIDYNMNILTAQKAVDIALQSPANDLTFEFQGGEPLINFNTIKFIIEYSENMKGDKYIEYNVVSNLTLLTDEMIDFFEKYDVSICTSIDGNMELQNINRPYKNKNSYNETLNGIKKLKEHGKNVNAIQTTSRYSLNKYKEIVDEYINLGLENIFVRPLTRLGKADNNWKNIGYTAEEFLVFFRNILDYIIEKNRNGIKLVEGHSSILLKKILLNKPVNYMELRSPCGGAIGQLAYYYDGNVYTCDEARMLSEMGDDSFKLGNVNKDTYKSLMESDTTKAMCIASCLECSSICKDCVYSPYCGTCPVINFAQENNIFSSKPNNFRCKIYGGILDILFEYLKNKDDEIIKIFETWALEN